MQTKLYVIHDITAEVYTQPFHALNDLVAKRILMNAVNTPGSSISDNPEDFRLYRIGFYDDQTAAIHQEKPEFIIRASELVVRSVPGSDNSTDDQTLISGEDNAA